MPLINPLMPVPQPGSACDLQEISCELVPRVFQRQLSGTSQTSGEQGKQVSSTEAERKNFVGNDSSGFSAVVWAVESLSPFYQLISRWTWISQYRMFPFWILLELRMMEVVMTTGAISRAKLQSYCHHQQTNTQLFYSPYALSVTQPTVSKH